MMKMNWPKLGPARAQTKIKKKTYITKQLSILLHTPWHLRLCTWHPCWTHLWQKYVRTKQLVVLPFEDFHNSVLRLQEATGNNVQNDLAEVGAKRKIKNKSYVQTLFNTFAHHVALAACMSGKNASTAIGFIAFGRFPQFRFEAP